MRLAAFEPDIPQNLGAMIRIAACFGVQIHVIEPCGFPFSVKSFRRSAMDYADVADIVHHSSWRAFQRDRAAGRLVLMTTNSNQGLWNFNFDAEDTILMGRETSGVPAEVHEAADQSLRIPIVERARSLNVAVAAGIAISEGLRQTAHWTGPCL